MATPKRFVISLHEAGISKHDPSSYLIKLSLLHGSPRREITALKLNEVLEAADTFAAEHGKACHIYIKCLDRKPPGFDKATATHSMFRNMDKAIAE